MGTSSTATRCTRMSASPPGPSSSCLDPAGESSRRLAFRGLIQAGSGRVLGRRETLAATTPCSSPPSTSTPSCSSTSASWAWSCASCASAPALCIPACSCTPATTRSASRSPVLGRPCMMVEHTFVTTSTGAPPHSRPRPSCSPPSGSSPPGPSAKPRASGAAADPPPRGPVASPTCPSASASTLTAGRQRRGLARGPPPASAPRRRAPRRDHRRPGESCSPAEQPFPVLRRRRRGQAGQDRQDRPSPPDHPQDVPGDARRPGPGGARLLTLRDISKTSIRPGQGPRRAHTSSR
jgi:hypothetical protein